MSDTEELRQEILGAICDSYLKCPAAPPGIAEPRFAFPYAMLNLPRGEGVRSLIPRMGLNESARAILRIIIDGLIEIGPEYEPTFDMLNCGLTRAGAIIERKHVSYFQVAGQA